MQEFLTPRMAALLTAIGAFAFFAIAINSQEHGWPAWYRLAQNAQQATANVTRIDPANHQRCFFEYPAGGKNYQSWEDGCSNLAAGAAIPIIYSQSDPSFAVSANTSPQAQLLLLVLAPILISLMAGVLAALRFPEMDAK
jgi:hypothetical protein